LWKKKIIVVHANGMHWKKAFAVMATVNIARILDYLMIAVNVGRVLKMRKQEIIYIAVDNKDANWFLNELCEVGRITDPYLRVDRRKKTIETSNCKVIAVSLSGCYTFAPISPIDFYLYSSKPITTQLELIKNRYNELKTIEMHLSTFATKIDMKILINILNGVEDEDNG
jgi:hypothetical protein